MRGKREYNHRTLLLSVILLLLNIANVTSQNYTKTFKIDFSENDFLLEESEGMYRITPNEILYDWEYNYSEPSGLSKPCIPYVKLHILIPDNYRIKEVSFNVDSVIYAEGVRLEPVPPIGEISTGANEMQSLYPSQYYPIEINFVDGIESIFDGYRIADFEISLFAYNAFSGLLSMASSIYLTLNVEPTINDSFIHTGDMDSFLKRFVYNPEDFGKGLEGWTPVPANIVADGKQWNLHHVMPHAVDYVYNIKQWIEGDTLVDGELCQKLYTLTTTEDERVSQKETLNVDYCQQVGRKFYKNGELMFDFDLQLSDTFLLVEFLDTTYTMVTHVGDTVLNDGVVRRFLKVNEFFPEYSYVKPNSYDIWVEGVGSLSMGVYDNHFTAKGYVTTLQSCTYDDVIIYQKENSSQIVVTNSETRGKNVRFLGQFLHCTAPGAVKLEVYTMDALKVGETAFVNGEAAIKVGTTPALYLYIVTYPDGHRESGKVLVNEE